MNKQYLDFAEKAFAIFGLLFFSNSIDALVPALESPSRYLVWFGSSGLILLRWKYSLYAARQNFLIWIVFGLSVSSFLWSEKPDLTLVTIREVLQMTTFGLYLASRFSLKEQLKLVAITFSLIIFFCLSRGILQPSLGIHQGGAHSGAWRGIYTHKNVFGNRMVLSAVTFFILTINEKKILSFPWLGLFFSIFMILLTTSKTALIVSIILMSTIFLYRQYRWQGKQTILFLDIFILIVGCIAIFLFNNWEPFILSLGRDPTLTGRTKLWEIAFKNLADKPLLGFGRSVFWATGSKYALEAGANVGRGYIAPHSHNGFVDLLLEIGVIGFLFFILSLFVSYKKALQKAYQTKKPEQFWPLGFLLFLIMYNITESLILRSTNWFWVLYIASSLSSIQASSHR